MISDEVQAFSKEITARTTRKDMLTNLLNDVESQLQTIDVETMEKANIALQKFSEAQRLKSRKTLEDLCTLALQYAFNPNTSAELTLESKRGRPSSDLYIVNNATGVKSSPESSGGGIVDIVSNALRFIVAEIIKDPEVDGPIILDEAYKHLSKEYTPAIAQFLKQLVDDFGRQIILLTHNDFLAQAATDQIHVSIDEEGVSHVEQQEIAQ